jgi:hypothetical protein
MNWFRKKKSTANENQKVINTGGMIDGFLKKFPEIKIIEKPSAELIEKYKGLLPEAVLWIWENYGFGIYMNGYLRFVNPEEWREFLCKSVNVYIEGTHVIATTAFGDFLIWEGAEERLKIVNYRYGYSEVIGGSRFNVFMNRKLPDVDFQKSLKAGKIGEAIGLLGVPMFDECYGYVPALVIGGSEKIENLQMLKIREHLMIVSELTGKIE